MRGTLERGLETQEPGAALGEAEVGRDAREWGQLWKEPRALGRPWLENAERREGQWFWQKQTQRKG